MICSMTYELPFSPHSATVVDAVAEEASTFNGFQHHGNFVMLNLKDLQEELLVTHLVPNQIPGPIEICENLLSLSD